MKKKLIIIIFAVIAAVAVAVTLSIRFTVCSNNGDDGADTDGDKHTHSYTESLVEASCTEKGYTLHTCECGDSYKDNYTDALGHTEVIDSAVPASCTKTGLTEGKHCSKCNAVLVAQTVIQKTAHTEVIDSAVPASCTKAGLTEGKHCSECNTVLVAQQVTNELGHDYVSGQCSRCKDLDPDFFTQGLEYSEIIENGAVVSYAVSGIGKATDKDIIIPPIYNGKPVTKIANSAFKSKKILSAVIPDSVVTIEESTFNSCSSLETIKIGKNVTTIGDEAFWSCSKLKSVVIPSSVTSISCTAFNSCDRIESITVEVGNTKYHSAGDCIIETQNKKLIAGCKQSVIPNDGSVTSIGESAFESCGFLKSITIPEGITSIGYNSFRFCGNLTSVTLPDGLISIGGAAFRYCGLVGEVIIPDTVSEIDIFAFADCDEITSVNIPDKVTQLNNRTFSNCSKLTSITIGKGVKSIGNRNFSGCSELTKVYYNGTAEDWESIGVGGNNEPLQSATVYFYSETQPSGEGNYWRYVDGKALAW